MSAMKMRKLMVSAGIAAGVIYTAGAHASTISGSFTDLQGDHVLWSATVDPGVTLSKLVCCTLPANQGDDTIKNVVNIAFGTSFTANVGKQDPLSGFSVNWTGPSADAFALHFGGPHGGNEVLLLLSGDTSLFNFSMTGTQYALSSLQGFGPGVSQAPLPAALPLFASGLGGIGLLAWARRKWKKTAAVA
jgi:hypothetical protein